MFKSTTITIKDKNLPCRRCNETEAVQIVTLSKEGFKKECIVRRLYLNRFIVLKKLKRYRETKSYKRRSGQKPKTPLMNIF